MWFFVNDDIQEGPYKEEVINSFISEGKIRKNTLVWKNGMSDWSPAIESSLSKYFPPPSPKIQDSAKELSAISPVGGLYADTTESEYSKDLISDPSLVRNGFVDPSKSLKWLKRFLILFSIACVFCLTSDIVGINFISEAKNGFPGMSQQKIMSKADFVDNYEKVTSWLYLGIYIFTAIVFARWIIRAGQNVRSLGAENLRISKGWAVGYYFIPIVSLWKPYQAMKEIYLSSKSPDNWESQKRSLLLPLWWTFWLMSMFLGQMVFRMALNAEEIKQYESLYQASILANITDFILGIISLFLILSVTKLQIKSYNKMENTL